MAQVDLERRIHRNQDTRALGKMSFVILNTFFKRIEKLELLSLKKELSDRIIQYNLVQNDYEPDVYMTEDHERPPMVNIPEYREKFKSIPCYGAGESQTEAARLK